ncbi:MAG: LLM class flavin-dependent oxidoreductase [Actinobacteria bacterium]|nr:LLM class flavin-dependent oxidoreductase [Actinomycetota bacterium]
MDHPVVAVLDDDAFPIGAERLHQRQLDRGERRDGRRRACLDGRLGVRQVRRAALMRVGLLFPPGADQAHVVPMAQRAERLGFDYFCCGEHVFFHGPVPNAFVALAAAAGATERIRLLSALTVLPVYPAALAAKLVATLDQVSRGRFEFGVGVGGEHPPEFEAVGVPVTERGRRADEALDLLAQLFGGAPVSWQGRFTAIHGQALEPAPRQRPRLPVWIGGRRRAAMRRAARYGDVWLPYLVTPERLASGLGRVRELATEFGRGSAAVRGAVFCWTAVDTQPARARRTVVTAVGDAYRQDFTGLTHYLLYGTPGQVARRVGEFAEAGARDLVVAPAGTATETDRTIELFAAEVLPAVQQLDASETGEDGAT